MVSCRPKSVKTRHEQERSFQAQRLHKAWETADATRRAASAALPPEPPRGGAGAVALRLSAEATPAAPFVERAAKMYCGGREARARCVALLVLRIQEVTHSSLCEQLKVKESIAVFPPAEDGPGGPYPSDDPVAAILYYVTGYVMIRLRLDATVRSCPVRTEAPCTPPFPCPPTSHLVATLDWLATGSTSTFCRIYC